MAIASFAVVLTTHNRNAECALALKSVLSQVSQFDEIIVVDDYSLPQFEFDSDLVENTKLKLIRNTQNIGVAASRNLGVLNCSSDYICFLDDDDLFSPDKLTTLRLQLGGRNFDIVYHDFMMSFPLEQVFVRRRKMSLPTHPSLFYNILRNNFIGGAPTICVKRNFFAKVGGFNESLLALEDWDFNIRAVKFGASLHYVPIPLTVCNYFLRRISTSTFSSRNVSAFSQILASLSDSMILSERRAIKQNYFITMSLAAKYRQNTGYAIYYSLQGLFCGVNLRSFRSFVFSIIPIKVSFWLLRRGT